jgi:hypothetical protein
MPSLGTLIEQPRVARWMGIALMAGSVAAFLFLVRGQELLNGAYCPPTTVQFDYQYNLSLSLTALVSLAWVFMMGLSAISAAGRRLPSQPATDAEDAIIDELRPRRVRIEAGIAVKLGVSLFAVVGLCLLGNASSYYCADKRGVLLHTLLGSHIEKWSDARTINFECHYVRHGGIFYATHVGFLDGAGVQLSDGLRDSALKSFWLVESSLRGHPWEIKVSDSGSCPPDLAEKLGIGDATSR